MVRSILMRPLRVLSLPSDPPADRLPRSFAPARAPVLVAALMLGACAGKKTESDTPAGPTQPVAAPQQAGTGQAQPAAAANPNLRVLTVDTRRCPVDGKQIDQLDLNHDGRADMITIYDDKHVITCKQGDLNFDGRLDAFLYYRDDGKVEREQFDQDYDGRIDLGRYFDSEGALTLTEIDTNGDSYVDTWRRFDSGRLIRMEVDRDGDGKPDMFTYYAAGHIDRIGYDVNGDSKVDQWDHDAARRARLARDYRKKNAAEAEKVNEGIGGEPEYLEKGEGKDAKEGSSEGKGDGKSKEKAEGKGKGKSGAKGKSSPKGKSKSNAKGKSGAAKKPGAAPQKPHDG